MTLYKLTVGNMLDRKFDLTEANIRIEDIIEQVLNCKSSLMNQIIIPK